MVEEAGIQIGDQILDVNGRSFESCRPVLENKLNVMVESNPETVQKVIWKMDTFSLKMREVLSRHLVKKNLKPIAKQA